MVTTESAPLFDVKRKQTKDKTVSDISLMFRGGYAPGPPPVYSRALETALRTELFETGNYSVLQRPNQRVNAKVSLTLLTVNELNIKDQLLSISGYLAVDWLDDRLSWSNTSATSQDYSSIDFLFSTEVYVWTPALIIENSIDDISIISDTKIPMRIRSDGRIAWNPAGIYKVACESDITYYPLDSQTCTIKFSTWGYTQAEINLILDAQEPVDLSFYGENGEWDLLSAIAYKSSDRSRGGQSFSSLSFAITLRRRPLFHALNTIFPVVLMAFLIPMVYKLPAESGEKMGYCLTVLLAYAVYLTLISDNIPSTSMNVCYLSIYLGLTMAFSTLSVNIVIFVLNAHFQGEKEVPNWINKIYRKCRCKKFIGSDVDKNKVSPSNDEKKKDNEILVESVQMEDYSETEKLTYREFSEILDKLFFIIYMVAISLTTFIFLIILLVHYSSI
ncbi:neuronal acetylcholine receptor subunit alpha-4-like [Saccostrea cucullata]|uniref:neuronal acetylcholine receptor subunit alpha-4-like n=1 Tax=Saccostrea cuccullata TaxID=36930 RepID=UPI002ED34128